MTSAITTHSAASSQRCPAIIHAVESCICFIVLYGELIEAEQTKMIHPEFAYTLTTPLCVICSRCGNDICGITDIAR